MSRYLLLFIINLPFILIAILNAVVSYKVGKLPRRKVVIQVVGWIIVMIGLASAQSIYGWLFSHNLTQTEPLSLFDVVQITGIVSLLFVVSGLRSRLDNVEQRFKDLHQVLSIRLSTDSKNEFK